MARPKLPLPPPPGGLARWMPGPRGRMLALLLVAVFAVAFVTYRGALPGDASFDRVVVWLPLLFAVLFAGFYLVARRAARRNQRGLDRLAAGDLDAAAAIFRELSRGSVFAAPAACNLGLALLRMGDVRGALAAFAAAERALRPRGRGLLAGLVAGSIALCDALLGDLDAAEAWSMAARARLTRPGHPSRLHLVAEALVLGRSGRDEAAARRLAECWGEIELTTSADLMRGVRLVRAYAVERAGGTAGEVEALLAGARPFRPGEYAWLSAGWKEMEVWLALKGFAPA